MGCRAPPRRLNRAEPAVGGKAWGPSAAGRSERKPPGQPPRRDVGGDGRAAAAAAVVKSIQVTVTGKAESAALSVPGVGSFWCGVPVRLSTGDETSKRLGGYLLATPPMLELAVQMRPVGRDKTGSRLLIDRSQTFFVLRIPFRERASWRRRLQRRVLA